MKMNRRGMDQSPHTEDSDQLDNPSGSPLPPAASPAAASPKREQSNSPVMLATMTPVSVIEYEEQEAAAASQKTVIYLPPGQNPQDVLYDHTTSQTIETANGPVSVVVQQPGTQLLNQTATYQGPPGTTVLVLSELVEDMSPLLGLR